MLILILIIKLRLFFEIAKVKTPDQTVKLN